VPESAPEPSRYLGASEQHGPGELTRCGHDPRIGSRTSFHERSVLDADAPRARLGDAEPAAGRGIQVGADHQALPVAAVSRCPRSGAYRTDPARSVVWRIVTFSDVAG